MKKTVATALVLFLAAAFLTAGGQEEKKASGGVQPTGLKWAHVYEASEPYHTWALWAADEIKKQTGGRYDIQVFPASSLGKESDINQALSLGTLDMIYTGGAFAGKTYGPIGMLEAPFMFKSYEHFIKASQSDFFTELADGYEKVSGGARPLSVIYYGTRCITSNKPIYKPEDMKGLKIRVPDAPLHLMFPRAVGANPAPIAFAEVYLALQQGVVDAQENPLPTIQAKKFYEVQKYITLSHHVTSGILTIVSPATWKKLSSGDKALFDKISKEAALKCSADIRKAEQELIAWFESKGKIVNEIDRQPFIDIVAPLLQNSPQMTWSLEQYKKLQAIAN